MAANLSGKKRAEIRALARQGFRIREIAVATGVSRDAVRRHAGGLIAPWVPPKADLGRLQRIVDAADAIGSSRADRAARFGLASAHSYDGMLCYARRRLAAEGSCSRPA